MQSKMDGPNREFSPSKSKKIAGKGSDTEKRSTRKEPDPHSTSSVDHLKKRIMHKDTVNKLKISAAIEKEYKPPKRPPTTEQLEYWQADWKEELEDNKNSSFTDAQTLSDNERLEEEDYFPSTEEMKTMETWDMFANTFIDPLTAGEAQVMSNVEALDLFLEEIEDRISMVAHSALESRATYRALSKLQSQYKEAEEERALLVTDKYGLPDELLKKEEEAQMALVKESLEYKDHQFLDDFKRQSKLLGCVIKVQRCWRMHMKFAKMAKWRERRLRFKKKHFAGWRSVTNADFLFNKYLKKRVLRHWLLVTEDARRVRDISAKIFEKSVNSGSLTIHAINLFFDDANNDLPQLVESDDIERRQIIMNSIKRRILRKLCNNWRDWLEAHKMRRQKALSMLQRALRKAPALRPVWAPELAQLVFHMWYRRTVYKREYKKDFKDGPPLFDFQMKEWDTWVTEFTKRRIRKKHAMAMGAVNFMLRMFRKWVKYRDDNIEMDEQLRTAIRHYENWLKTTLLYEWNNLCKGRGSALRKQVEYFQAWKNWAPRKHKLRLLKKKVRSHVSKIRLARVLVKWHNNFEEAVTFTEFNIHKLLSGPKFHLVLEAAYCIAGCRQQYVTVRCWRSWRELVLRQRRWRFFQYMAKRHAYKHLMTAVVRGWAMVADRMRKMRKGSKKAKKSAVKREGVQGIPIGGQIPLEPHDGLEKYNCYFECICQGYLPEKNLAKSTMYKMFGETSKNIPEKYTPTRKQVDLWFKAVEEAHFTEVRDLLRGGFHVNTICPDGSNRTALHMACSHLSADYIPIIMLLLHCGANLAIPDSQGNLPTKFITNPQVATLIHEHEKRMSNFDYTYWERRVAIDLLSEVHKDCGSRIIFRWMAYQLSRQRVDMLGEEDAETQNEARLQQRRRLLASLGVVQGGVLDFESQSESNSAISETMILVTKREKLIRMRDWIYENAPYTKIPPLKLNINAEDTQVEEYHEIAQKKAKEHRKNILLSDSPAPSRPHSSLQLDENQILETRGSGLMFSLDDMDVDLITHRATAATWFNKEEKPKESKLPKSLQDFLNRRRSSLPSLNLIPKTPSRTATDALERAEKLVNDNSNTARGKAKEQPSGVEEENQLFSEQEDVTGQSILTAHLNGIYNVVLNCVPYMVHKRLYSMSVAARCLDVLLDVAPVNKLLKTMGNCPAWYKEILQKKGKRCWVREFLPSKWLRRARLLGLLEEELQLLENRRARVMEEAHSLEARMKMVDMGADMVHKSSANLGVKIRESVKEGRAEAVNYKDGIKKRMKLLKVAENNREVVRKEQEEHREKKTHCVDQLNIIKMSVSRKKDEQTMMEKQGKSLTEEQQEELEQEEQELEDMQKELKGILQEEMALANKMEMAIGAVQSAAGKLQGTTTGYAEKQAQVARQAKLGLRKMEDLENIKIEYKSEKENTEGKQRQVMRYLRRLGIRLEELKLVLRIVQKSKTLFDKVEEGNDNKIVLKSGIVGKTRLSLGKKLSPKRGVRRRARQKTLDDIKIPLAEDDDAQQTPKSEVLSDASSRDEAKTPKYDEEGCKFIEEADGSQILIIKHADETQQPEPAPEETKPIAVPLALDVGEETEQPVREREGSSATEGLYLESNASSLGGTPLPSPALSGIWAEGKIGVLEAQGTLKSWGRSVATVDEVANKQQFFQRDEEVSIETKESDGSKSGTPLDDSKTKASVATELSANKDSVEDTETTTIPVSETIASADVSSIQRSAVETLLSEVDSSTLQDDSELSPKAASVRSGKPGTSAGNLGPSPPASPGSSFAQLSSDMGTFSMDDLSAKIKKQSDDGQGEFQRWLSKMSFNDETERQYWNTLELLFRNERIRMAKLREMDDPWGWDPDDEFGLEGPGLDVEAMVQKDDDQAKSSRFRSDFNKVSSQIQNKGQETDEDGKRGSQTSSYSMTTLDTFTSHTKKLADLHMDSSETSEDTITVKTAEPLPPPLESYTYANFSTGKDSPAVLSLNIKAIAENESIASIEDGRAEENEQMWKAKMKQRLSKDMVTAVGHSVSMVAEKELHALAKQTNLSDDSSEKIRLAMHDAFLEVNTGFGDEESQKTEREGLALLKARMAENNETKPDSVVVDGLNINLESVAGKKVDLNSLRRQSAMRSRSQSRRQSFLTPTSPSMRRPSMFQSQLETPQSSVESSGWKTKTLSRSQRDSRRASSINMAGVGEGILQGADVLASAELTSGGETPGQSSQETSGIYESKMGVLDLDKLVQTKQGLGTNVGSSAREEYYIQDGLSKIQENASLEHEESMDSYGLYEDQEVLPLFGTMWPYPDEEELLSQETGEVREDSSIKSSLHLGSLTKLEPPPSPYTTHDINAPLMNKASMVSLKARTLSNDSSSGSISIEQYSQSNMPYTPPPKKKGIQVEGTPAEFSERPWQEMSESQLRMKHKRDQFQRIFRLATSVKGITDDEDYDYDMYGEEDGWSQGSVRSSTHNRLSMMMSNNLGRGTRGTFSQMNGSDSSVKGKSRDSISLRSGERDATSVRGATRDSLHPSKKKKRDTMRPGSTHSTRDSLHPTKRDTMRPDGKPFPRNSMQMKRGFGGPHPRDSLHMPSKIFRDSVRPGSSSSLPRDSLRIPSSYRDSVRPGSTNALPRDSMRIPSNYRDSVRPSTGSSLPRDSMQLSGYRRTASTDSAGRSKRDTHFRDSLRPSSVGSMGSIRSLRYNRDGRLDSGKSDGSASSDSRLSEGADRVANVVNQVRMSMHSKLGSMDLNSNKWRTSMNLITTMGRRHSLFSSESDENSSAYGKGTGVPQVFWSAVNALKNKALLQSKGGDGTVNGLRPQELNDISAHDLCDMIIVMSQKAQKNQIEAQQQSLPQGVRPTTGGNFKGKHPVRGRPKQTENLYQERAKSKGLLHSVSTGKIQMSQTAPAMQSLLRVQSAKESFRPQMTFPMTSTPDTADDNLDDNISRGSIHQPPMPEISFKGKIAKDSFSKMYHKAALDWNQNDEIAGETIKDAMANTSKAVAQRKKETGPNFELTGASFNHPDDLSKMEFNAEDMSVTQREVAWSKFQELHASNATLAAYEALKDIQDNALRATGFHEEVQPPTDAAGKPEEVTGGDFADMFIVEEAGPADESAPPPLVKLDLDNDDESTLTGSARKNAGRKPSIPTTTNKKLNGFALAGTSSKLQTKKGALHKKSARSQRSRNGPISPNRSPIPSKKSPTSPQVSSRTGSPSSPSKRKMARQASSTSTLSRPGSPQYPPQMITKIESSVKRKNVKKKKQIVFNTHRTLDPAALTTLDRAGLERVMEASLSQNLRHMLRTAEHEESVKLKKKQRKKLLSRQQPQRSVVAQRGEMPPGVELSGSQVLLDKAKCIRAREKQQKEVKKTLDTLARIDQNADDFYKKHNLARSQTAPATMLPEVMGRNSIKSQRRDSTISKLPPKKPSVPTVKKNIDDSGKTAESSIVDLSAKLPEIYSAFDNSMKTPPESTFKKEKKEYFRRRSSSRFSSSILDLEDPLYQRSISNLTNDSPHPKPDQPVQEDLDQAKPRKVPEKVRRADKPVLRMSSKIQITARTEDNTNTSRAKTPTDASDKSAQPSLPQSPSTPLDVSSSLHGTSELKNISDASFKSRAESRNESVSSWKDDANRRKLKGDETFGKESIREINSGYASASDSRRSSVLDSPSRLDLGIDVMNSEIEEVSSVEEGTKQPSIQTTRTKSPDTLGTTRSSLTKPSRDGPSSSGKSSRSTSQPKSKPSYQKKDKSKGGGSRSKKKSGKKAEYAMFEDSEPLIKIRRGARTEHRIKKQKDGEMNKGLGKNKPWDKMKRTSKVKNYIEIMTDNYSDFGSSESSENEQSVVSLSEDMKLINSRFLMARREMDIRRKMKTLDEQN